MVSNRHNLSIKRLQTIICFNPPFDKNVSTNIAKPFLNLIHKHFPRDNKLPKIFNRNSVKVGCVSTENIISVVNAHNKILLFKNIKSIQPSDCWIKSKYPLNGNYRTENILYNWAASTSIKPDKVYLEATEKDFTQRFHNHKNLSTTLLIVMIQHSPNTFATSKKNITKPQTNLS